MMKIPDVVATIVERDDKILLARRPLHTGQSGIWEFVGGKVEPGESQPEVLIHELRKELGTGAVVGCYTASHQREVSGRLIYLYVQHVPSYREGPRAHGHQDIVWCSPEEALRYPSTPADIPLLEAFILLHAARPADPYWPFYHRAGAATERRRL